jgi:hypothetical protein
MSKNGIESDKNKIHVSCMCASIVTIAATHTHTHTLILKDCARMFKSYKGLQYHLKRHKIPTDSLQCPQCMKVLAGRKRFENHIRLRHPDVDVELMVRENTAKKMKLLRDISPPPLSISLPISLLPPYSLCLSTLWLQSADNEYRPSVHADSDEEDPDDLDAGKTAEKDVGKGRGGTRRSKKRQKTSLLIAGAPVTLHQYQSTLKEKLEHLYGHREGEAGQGEGPLTSSSWQPMTEDWSRVPNR